MASAACKPKSKIIDINRKLKNSEHIHCRKKIEVSDFQRKIKDGVTEKDRRVLRGAMSLLGEHSTSVWRNAVVRCIGDEIDFTFYCGDSSKKFVVYFDERGEVKKQCSNSAIEQRIHCPLKIDVSDFQRQIQAGMTEKDRRVLRGGMTLLGEHPTWVWKNALVHCIGDEINFSFCCGRCTNRFLVCFDEKGKVKKQCLKAGRRLYLSNRLGQVLGLVGGLALRFGSGLRAIMP